MKRNTITLFCLWCFVVAVDRPVNADDLDVADLPEVVLKQIRAKYPNAEIDEIEMSGNEESYKVDLELGDDEIQLEYRHFEADMEQLAKEPRNIEWLKVCEPMQIPLPGGGG